MAYKILIYEDNDSLAGSMKMLFEWQTDYELVAVMPNAVNVLDDLKQFSPHVILMDIEMPGISGVEALRKIREVNSDVPVIMFTVFDDDKNIFESMQSGASGYILKKNIDQLLPSVTDVLRGGAPMTSSVARKVLDMFARPKVYKIQEDELTHRENEILQLLVKGFSYKMIADELSVSIETVRSHIKSIYRKLQVNSAAEAVYKTLKR